MRLIVQGRAPLKGSYQVSGNSNEAIVLIAASLMSEAETILSNVPNTAAVRQMLESTRDLGTTSKWQGQQLHLQTAKLVSRQVGGYYTSHSAAPILFLAPILTRREYATLEWNEPIGRLHTHLTALRDLGQRIDMHGQTITFTAQRWQKQEILLLETSVTTTALVCMLAAALGDETIIYNAASEPHLRSLQQMLSRMGVVIDGIGSNLLTIKGAKTGLIGASHTVQPDHIEIASIAAISAVTPGHITIAPVIPTDLRMINKVYEQLGVQLILDGTSLHVYEHSHLKIASLNEEVDLTISTAPWPGFPSDLIAIATVLATQTNGTTLIHEKLFSNRLLFVDKLKAMGAQIVLCDPHRAIIIGASPLRGEYIDTPDVRIGMGLLVAALCAEGESVIDRAELIGRNFENVVGKLIGLGAAIEVK